LSQFVDDAHPQPVPIATETRTLDRGLVAGIAWTAIARWSSQVLSWASLLIIARLLSPSDFGLLGMATLYLGLIQTFSEFGLGSAVVTLRDLTGQQVDQINSVSVLSGFLGFALSLAAAVPLARFFRSPQLSAVVSAMGVGFVISGFRTVPYSLLQKELRFKLLSAMDAAQAAAQALGSLALALLGFKYWALVLGNLLGTAVATGLTVACRSRGFASPRLESIRHALRFSWRILVSRLGWYGYSNADFLVAGRVLGAGPLGAYTFAWNLATLPVEKVTSLVMRVTPAFFSAVQKEHAALRRYLRTLTESLALVTFPATIGLGIVAPEFVHLALGKKWESVIAPLELLALYASIRSIATLPAQVIIVVGGSRFGMWNSVQAVILMPIAFYVGSHWGTVGIAWGWIVGYPFILAPLYWAVFRRIHMPIAEYWGALRPPLHGCVIMSIMILVLKWSLPAAWPLYFRFGLEVATGAAAYLLVLWTSHRDRARAFVAFAKSVRG